MQVMSRDRDQLRVPAHALQIITPGESWDLASHADWGHVVFRPLPAAHVTDCKAAAQLRKEAIFLKSLSHPNILQVLGLVWESGPPGRRQHGLVLPHLPHGSLARFLHTHTRVHTHVKVNVAHQICCGLTHLHSLTPPLVHAQLHAHNVLVDDGLNIKITDFEMISKWRTHADDVRGHVAHVPPEVWGADAAGCPGSPAGDVFAFAMLLWHLFTQREPFEDASPAAVRSAVCAGGRPDISLLPPDTPAVVEALVQRSWAQRPQSRPNSAAIKPTLDALVESLESEILEARLSLVMSVHDSGDKGYRHEKRAVLSPTNNMSRKPLRFTFEVPSRPNRNDASAHGTAHRNISTSSTATYQKSSTQIPPPPAPIAQHSTVQDNTRDADREWLADVLGPLNQAYSSQGEPANVPDELGGREEARLHESNQQAEEMSKQWTVTADSLLLQIDPSYKDKYSVGVKNEVKSPLEYFESKQTYEYTPSRLGKFDAASKQLESPRNTTNSARVRRESVGDSTEKSASHEYEKFYIGTTKNTTLPKALDSSFRNGNSVAHKAPSWVRSKVGVDVSPGVGNYEMESKLALDNKSAQNVLGNSSHLTFGNSAKTQGSGMTMETRKLVSENTDRQSHNNNVIAETVPAQKGTSEMKKEEISRKDNYGLENLSLEEQLKIIQSQMMESLNSASSGTGYRGLFDLDKFKVEEETSGESECATQIPADAKQLSVKAEEIKENLQSPENVTLEVEEHSSREPTEEDLKPELPKTNPPNIISEDYKSIFSFQHDIEDFAVEEKLEVSNAMRDDINISDGNGYSSEIDQAVSIADLERDLEYLSSILNQDEAELSMIEAIKTERSPNLRPAGSDQTSTQRSEENNNIVLEKTTSSSRHLNEANVTHRSPNNQENSQDYVFNKASSNDRRSCEQHHFDQKKLKEDLEDLFQQHCYVPDSVESQTKAIQHQSVNETVRTQRVKSTEKSEDSYQVKQIPSNLPKTLTKSSILQDDSASAKHYQFDQVRLNQFSSKDRHILLSPKAALNKNEERTAAVQSPKKMPPPPPPKPSASKILGKRSSSVQASSELVLSPTILSPHSSRSGASPSPGPSPLYSPHSEKSSITSGYDSTKGSTCADNELSSDADESEKSKHIPRPPSFREYKAGDTVNMTGYPGNTSFPKSDQFQLPGDYQRSCATEAVGLNTAELRNMVGISQEQPVSDSVEYDSIQRFLSGEEAIYEPLTIRTTSSNETSGKRNLSNEPPASKSQFSHMQLHEGLHSKYHHQSSKQSVENSLQVQSNLQTSEAFRTEMPHEHFPDRRSPNIAQTNTARLWSAKVQDNRMGSTTNNDSSSITQSENYGADQNRMLQRQTNDMLLIRTKEDDTESSRTDSNDPHTVRAKPCWVSVIPKPGSRVEFPPKQPRTRSRSSSDIPDYENIQDFSNPQTYQSLSSSSKVDTWNNVISYSDRSNSGSCAHYPSSSSPAYDVANGQTSHQDSIHSVSKTSTLPTSPISPPSHSKLVFSPTTIERLKQIPGVFTGEAPPKTSPQPVTEPPRSAASVVRTGADRSAPRGNDCDEEVSRFTSGRERRSLNPAAQRFLRAASCGGQEEEEGCRVDRWAQHYANNLHRYGQQTSTLTRPASTTPDCQAASLPRARASSFGGSEGPRMLPRALQPKAQRTTSEREFTTPKLSRASSARESSGWERGRQPRRDADASRESLPSPAQPGTAPLTAPKPRLERRASHRLSDLEYRGLSATRGPAVDREVTTSVQQKARLFHQAAGNDDNQSRKLPTRCEAAVDDAAVGLVSRHVGPEWVRLARGLRFLSDEAVDTLRAQHRGESHSDNAARVLRLWREVKGSDASLRSLADALLNMDRRDLALLLDSGQ